MKETNFPILEIEMTDRSLFVSLMDENNTTIEALFPKELVDLLATTWGAFQTGEAREPKVLWRLYTGHWHKKGSEHAGETAPVPERVRQTQRVY